MALEKHTDPKLERRLIEREKEYSSSARRNMYCKFGNFRENFIFTNITKRHICDVLNSQIEHFSPISVNDRMNSPFHKDFIFTKLRLCKFPENKTLAKISEFTVRSFKHS